MAFPLAIFVMGFTALVGQLVLIRELLVVFYGNEFTIGAILGTWLLFVALGSWGLEKIIRKWKLDLGSLLLIQILLTIILPFQIFLIRAIKSILHLPQGELVGFFPTILSSLLILAPLCLLLGLEFTLLAKICSSYLSLFPSPTGGGKGWGPNRFPLGQVYVIESLGSLIGGLGFTFILIHYLQPLQIVFILGMLNLISGLALLPYMKNRLLKRIEGGLLVSLLIFWGFVFFSKGASFLQEKSLRWLWGNEFVESKDSGYSNIVVTRQGEQFTLFENGLLSFSTQDFLTNEQIAHLPLLQHPNPENVLLIGGGIAGVLAEILKHPSVKEIDYVQLDPQLVSIGQKYLSQVDLMALNDKRVKVNLCDARLFIKKTNKKYDVIILNLLHPFTAQINRCYTLEFFREIKRCLDESGIFSLGIICAENYINQEVKNLAGCIYKTTRQVFSKTLIVPGDYMFIFATDKNDLLTFDVPLLQNRFYQRSITTSIFTPYHLINKFNLYRMNYTLRILSSGDKGIKVNRDFLPIAVWYDTLLWASLFSLKFSRVLSFLGSFGWSWLIISFILILLLLTPPLIHHLEKRVREGLRGTKREVRSQMFLTTTIAVVGFVGMVSEVIVLLAFQMLYGYVYQELGLIMAMFMGGLAFGSWLTTKASYQLKTSHLKWLLILLVLYPPFLFLILTFLSSTTLRGILIHLIFSLLLGIVGLLDGASFPLVAKLHLGHSREVSRTAGMLYGADLLGAFVGAILSGAIFLPTLGLLGTCLLSSILSLMAFISVTLMRNSKELFY
ncbi:MAG: fused MFS/spermidine synthase [Candidatus Edwardsbacteria bacterium]